MSDKNSKMTLNFTTLVNKTREIPKLEIQDTRNNTYLKYGTDNLFPDYLYELFTHSSQFSSIVMTMLKYVFGNGIVNNTGFEVVNRKDETFEEFVEKLIIDYIIFGGFAFQITRNKQGNIAELNWVDFRYVRTNADEDKIYYNTTWKNGRIQPKVYDRWFRCSKTPTSIFYYKGRLTRHQYPTPMYMAALTALEISTQIPDYHLNNLTNGFHPSAVINFNNGSNLSDEVMEEIEEKVKEKFQGTQNASKILLSFNDNKDSATTVERLSDEGNIDIYNSLAESVRQDIYSAFRINKILLGDASENTGFNKTSYLESFALYNKTVIEPIQREIKEVFEKIFGEGCISFDKFELDWAEDSEQETTKMIE